MIKETVTIQGQYQTSSQLPTQLTSFIGRANEVEEISRLLTDPDCRLLTLVGAGGIGKTRLAVQVAAQLEYSCFQGIYFVPLQAAESFSGFLSTLIEALNLPLNSPESPETQLLNYLSDKELLLILDNFEQLMSPPKPETRGVNEFVASLLLAATRVKLLVTSREMLNLAGEWLYQVEGLPFPQPSSEPDERADSYSAVQLFIERAGRVRRDFSPAEEQTGIIRICQLVEGVPLALELAAAWTRTLRCDVIAAEIQRNLDFLATNRQNVPGRQQSIRAVFDHSWQLLNEKERHTFKCLSVFRGGFRREAAERVAGASLPILTALVDKSLIRSEPDGRYRMHELLRQYAAEQLVLSPEDVQQVYDLHCTYYADFLYRRLEHLKGGRQREATLELAAELENIRVSWQWAVELVNLAAIQKSSEALSMFLQFQGRYLETALAFQKAVERLRREPATEQTELILAKLLVSLGWARIRLGRLGEAEAALVEAQALCRRLNVFLRPGYANHPLLPLGIIASIRGNYSEAARLGEEVRRASVPHHHLWNIQIAYYLLARAALLQSQYEAAQQYAQQAYLTTQTTQDDWFRAYCLNELGNVACALGDYPAAKEHYQASYALREAFDDPEGMAVALNCLGEIALRQGDYLAARQLYQQSQATYKKISDRGGLATSLAGLGQVAMALGDYPAARQQFQQALQLAGEIQFVPLILSLLVGVGELLLQVGRPERGLELLAMGIEHPGSDESIRASARQLLAQHKIELFSKREPSGLTTLEALITLIQTELARPIEAEGQGSRGAEEQGSKGESFTPAPPSTSSGHGLSPRAPALVEPLSEREIEVLRLVAAGLQNQEIAARLVVTLSTVKTHINNIYRKLDVTNRVQAVSRAREIDLL